MGNVMSLKGLKDAPLELCLDDGTYDVEITKSIFECSKNKGTPGLNLTMQVKEGAPQKNGDSPVGQNIFYSIWFSDKNSGRAMSDTKKLMMACGINVDDLDEDNIDPDILIGRRCRVTTKQKRDDYGLKANVQQVEPLE